MKITGKRLVQLFKEAATDWSDDHAPRLGASLAFYTIFSLAPLLTIVISIATLWFSENASQQIFNELGSVIGSDNAVSLQKMLVQPEHKGQGIFTTISAAVMLMLGATGVFVQLQDALNEIWEVKAKPGQGIMGFIRHRLLSFAMVLGIAFLLLVSLLLTTAISAVGKYFSSHFGSLTVLWQGLNMIISFGLITLLFALMFKYVPDAEISWRDVWAGALFTSVLFTVGKFGLGLYLGKSSVASTYSVAGSLIVLLLWVYYTAQIVFFGAELTQEYADMAGREVKPSAHAEWDEEKKCATRAAAGKREAAKAAKANSPTKPEEKMPGRTKPEHAVPQPAFAMAAAGNAPGAVSGSGTNRKLTIGGLLLLLFVLVPIEKKLFGTRFRAAD